MKKSISYIYNLSNIKINRNFASHFDFINQNDDYDSKIYSDSALDCVKIRSVKGKR